MKKLLVSLFFAVGAFLCAADFQSRTDAERTELFVQACSEVFTNKKIDSFITYSQDKNLVVLGQKRNWMSAIKVVGYSAQMGGFLITSLASGSVAWLNYSFFKDMISGSKFESYNVLGTVFFALGVYVAAVNTLAMYQSGKSLYTLCRRPESVVLKGTLVVTPKGFILPHRELIKWEHLKEVRFVQPDAQNKKARIAFDLEGGHSFESDDLKLDLLKCAVDFMNMMVAKVKNPSS